MIDGLYTNIRERLGKEGWMAREFKILIVIYIVRNPARSVIRSSGVARNFRMLGKIFE